MMDLMKGFQSVSLHTIFSRNFPVRHISTLHFHHYFGNVSGRGNTRWRSVRCGCFLSGKYRSEMCPSENVCRRSIRTLKSHVLLFLIFCIRIPTILYMNFYDVLDSWKLLRNYKRYIYFPRVSINQIRMTLNHFCQLM